MDAREKYYKSGYMVDGTAARQLQVVPDYERQQEQVVRPRVAEQPKHAPKLSHGIDFLSMIGSIAPLIGLFGTIWGIMSSFSAIGASSSTTLGVIAPGIATALSTTALGLIVAIPAVIGYNKITTDLSNYAIKLESFTGEFTAIISRQIDENING